MHQDFLFDFQVMGLWGCHRSGTSRDSHLQGSWPLLEYGKLWITSMALGLCKKTFSGIFEQRAWRFVSGEECWCNTWISTTDFTAQVLAAVLDCFSDFLWSPYVLPSARSALVSLALVQYSQKIIHKALLSNFRLSVMARVHYIHSCYVHSWTMRKAKFSILCDVIFLVRLQGKFEIDN